MPTGTGQYWVSSTGTASTQYIAPWYEWDRGTAATTASLRTVWGSWAYTTTSATTNYVDRAYYSPPIETPEEIEARQRKSRQDRLRYMWSRWVREAAAYWRAKDREVAKARARDLLISCLTPEQRREYRANQYFHVHTARGTYRIYHGAVGNVFLMDEGEHAGSRLQKYCIHLTDDEPDEDTMLAQKFLLETDEDRFLEVANRHW